MVFCTEVGVTYSIRECDGDQKSPVHLPFMLRQLLDIFSSHTLQPPFHNDDILTTPSSVITYDSAMHQNHVEGLLKHISLGPAL